MALPKREGSKRRALGEKLDPETRRLATFRPAGVLEFVPAPTLSAADAARIAKERGAVVTNPAPGPKIVQPGGWATVESATVSSEGVVELVAKTGSGTDTDLAQVAVWLADRHGVPFSKVVIRRIPA